MNGTNLLTTLERTEEQLGHKGYFLKLHELTRDYCNGLSMCVYLHATTTHSTQL